LITVDNKVNYANLEVKVHLSLLADARVLYRGDEVPHPHPGHTLVEPGENIM
jgi:hypothetical protein